MASEFVMSRVFDAPRALLWQCFTDPERMKHWWGPKGFTVLSSKMDLRVGGSYHYGMKAPNGSSHVGPVQIPRNRAAGEAGLRQFVFGRTGGITRHPGSATWPLYMLSTFTFEDAPGAKTKFTVTWRTLDATDEEQKTFDAMHDSMTQGWAGTMDQLAAYLARAK